MTGLRSFASDNNAGVHPAVLKAVVAANAGPDVVAYGGDPLTQKVEARLAREFGAHSAHVVLSGAAANVLCMAAGLKAHQAALCAEAAHVTNDEGGATERFVGCKLLGVRTVDGKFTAAELERKLDSLAGGRVLPRLVSVTQCTEVGTVYSLSELQAISRVCRKRGLLLHMDGARLSNAAARLGVSLKRLTRGCGVDLLSFGLTKNGALMADSVVIFDRKLDEGFRLIRTQGLQLASKQRFMAAQFAAMLDGALWLKNARRANEMAALLAREAARVPGVEVVYPVETNAVFARLPRAVLERFARRRFFYVWDRERGVARWMCSFAMTPQDVRAFASDLRRAGSRER